MVGVLLIFDIYSLADFALQEYQQARLALRGISDRMPYATTMGRPFLSDAATELISHIPLVRPFPCRPVGCFTNNATQ